MYQVQVSSNCNEQSFLLNWVKKTFSNSIYKNDLYLLNMFFILRCSFKFFFGQNPGSDLIWLPRKFDVSKYDRQQHFIPNHITLLFIFSCCLFYSSSLKSWCFPNSLYIFKKTGPQSVLPNLPTKSILKKQMFSPFYTNFYRKHTSHPPP